MKAIFFTLINLILFQASGYAQPQQQGTPKTDQGANPPYSPDKSNFPTVATSLPVSRPQALAKTKLTGKRVEYELTIDEQSVNITGKPIKAMTINGGIPGPTMRFTQGDVAVIHVHNKLKTESSLHWHGLLVPNIQDGVSYLETPPILAGMTRTFEYPLVQSGTYWFHSHTKYQEQVGVYGSIVIKPQQMVHNVDHDLVLLLSDWTNENPAYILKNLKRRNEWYSIKKGNVQSLNRIIRHKAVGAYLRQSMMKMAPMDISDVYYDRFLINGKDTVRYPEIKPGQTVRLRVINAGASTYFHVNYAGGPMKLIAADGVDVQPVDVNRRLIAIAETYDFLITVPPGGSFEVRASAQDGSGYATALLGSGPVHYAPTVPKPDLYKLTANMSRMGGMGMGTMNMGKTDTTAQANRDMNGPMVHEPGAMSGMPMPGNSAKVAPKKADSMPGMDMGGMDHDKMNMGKPKQSATAKPKKADPMAGMDHSQMDMKGMTMSAAQPKKKGHAMASMQHGDQHMSGMNMSKDGQMAMTGMDHGQTKMGAAKTDSTPGIDHAQMKMDGQQSGGMAGMNHSQMKMGASSGSMAGMDMGGMGMMDEQNTIDYSILSTRQ